MSLKLCTFNCRGLQDYVKRRKTFHYLRSINTDIIYLQETHADPDDDEKLWKNQWGNRPGLLVVLLIVGGLLS